MRKKKYVTLLFVALLCASCDAPNSSLSASVDSSSTGSLSSFESSSGIESSSTTSSSSLESSSVDSSSTGSLSSFESSSSIESSSTTSSSSLESSSNESSSSSIGEEYNPTFTNPSAAQYYASIDFSKSGAGLKTDLFNLIKSAKVISYNGLWDAYRTTDVKSNGKIWDMYSNYEYTVGSNQCGNYGKEGDCYNREHSVPQSWFKEASPMKSDLYHVYPTDGKVNGIRNNYPFGETNSPSTTTGNGSKLGSSSFPGYSGTVFEPIDEYKGDFARTYFYMATRYQNVLSSWSGQHFSKNTFPSLNQYSLDLFTKWHEEDPVSEKEINRTDAVQALQNNRNPFIDCPELVARIWQ